MDVEVIRNTGPQELSDDVAHRLVTLLAGVQADGRVPAVALTGGSIAITIHEAVVADPDRDSVDWGRVDVWFGDERFVPADSPDRNVGQASRAMLDHLPVDPARVHPMPPSDGEFADDLDAAAAAYGDELRAKGAGGFDLVMLGVGRNGHVASLMPGFAELDADDAIAVPVRNSPKPPPERISLTFPALERTREVWFVVAGEDKAERVRQALDPTTDFHDIPAARPKGRERTLWFVDEAAASRLS
ncbi:MAG TPA: 6-phosphogluconolactonase [Nocardioidaceae bacterium]|nr:6-phosphogluconolactonase [Nocardioidaceae bacterium]